MRYSIVRRHEQTGAPAPNRTRGKGLFNYLVGSRKKHFGGASQADITLSLSPSNQPPCPMRTILLLALSFAISPIAKAIAQQTDELDPLVVKGLLSLCSERDDYSELACAFYGGVEVENCGLRLTSRRAVVPHGSREPTPRCASMNL